MEKFFFPLNDGSCKSEFVLMSVVINNSIANGMPHYITLEHGGNSCTDIS
jgi:hypothetical protein